MNQIKYKTIGIAFGIVLLVILLGILIYKAIEDSMPISAPPVYISDYADITDGEIRTDVVLCFQQKDNIKYLINLSYQNSESWLDEYPAEPFETYDIQAGDFAEMTYQAEYSVGGEEGHSQYIKKLGDFKQIYAIEALSKRNLKIVSDIWHTVRQADSYPIRIYQNPYADFVMIPANEKYKLFLPDQDKAINFNEYRQVVKPLTINGETKTLRMWVLCNSAVSDDEILDALYQGTVTENPDFFFVGYDSPYPFSFTANGIEQNSLYHAKKMIISKASPETCSYHFMAQELENPEVFTTLPEEVQRELSTSWNHADDVLLFGGKYDESAELTFNDNNQLALVSGNTESSGYVLIYLESGFFENICSKIAE